MGVVMSRPRTIGLGGLAAFVVLVTIQHLFRGDDLPPADHFVSEYARGPGGWVQVMAFLAWAAALGATLLLLRRPGVGRGRRIALGFVALGLAGGVLGALLAALFATETVGGVLPPGAVKSTAGKLHDLGSAGIFFGLLLAAVASVRVVRRRGYRLSVLGMALLLLLIPGGLIAAGYDAPGWGQRGFIAVGCLWHWRFLHAVGRERA